MAHFAQLDNNNKVLQVIVITNDDAPGNFPESEPVGQAFIASLGLPGTWKQTSYNGNFRHKYAAIGDTYDATNDVFIETQPAPWFTLNETFDWVCPPGINPTTGNPFTADELLINELETSMNGLVMPGATNE
jgi:hypothetical protein